MKIIRLRIIDFDSFENLERQAEHIRAPFISIEKYFLNAEALNNFVFDYMSNRKRYKGWDDSMYPKHIADEIEVIEE